MATDPTDRRRVGRDDPGPSRVAGNRPRPASGRHRHGDPQTGAPGRDTGTGVVALVRPGNRRGRSPGTSFRHLWAPTRTPRTRCPSSTRRCSTPRSAPNGGSDGETNPSTERVDRRAFLARSAALAAAGTAGAMRRRSPCPGRRRGQRPPRPRPPATAATALTRRPGRRDPNTRPAERLRPAASGNDRRSDRAHPGRGGLDDQGTPSSPRNGCWRPTSPASAFYDTDLSGVQRGPGRSRR